jgi:iron complex outermembrane recepter protein
MGGIIMRKFAQLLATTGFVATGLLPAAAAAQEVPSGEVESDQSVLTADIVVTAQRRSENVQDVPIAITALGGAQIRELNIQDAQRIVDFVPGLKAGGLGGAGGPPFFNIRGITFIDFGGINETSVALYVDDVYQVAQGAGTQQVFDLERVEVLRGPQGTLFGRNSTAGVIHYVTRKPTDELSGDISLQYGSANQTIVQIAAGGPVTDGLRARFAIKYNRDDGFQRNTVNGDRFMKTNAIAARAIVQADLGPDAMLEFKLSYATNDGQAPIHRPYFVLDPSNPSGYCGGRPVPGTPADLAHAACILAGRGISRTAGVAITDYSSSRGTTDMSDLPFAYTSWGGYAKLTADLGFADFVSISGYENYRQTFSYDADGYDNRPYGSAGRDLGVHFAPASRTFSQELRLSNELDGGLKWLLGGYYYNGRQRSDNTISVDGVKTDLIGYTTHTKSFAGFAQLDVPLAETLTLTGGLRYTDDERRFDPLDCRLSITSTICAPTPISRITDGELTYRAALDYHPTDDLLFYAAISHGFKSGGWNPNRTATLRGPVGSEEIDNYEVGLKSQFFDRRVTFNLSAFYYKYHGIQALIGSTDPITSAAITSYINGGDPRAYGIEGEFSARLSDQLEVRLGGAWLDSKIIADPLLSADGRILNGNQLAQAPEFSANAIIRYTVPLGAAGSLTFQTDGRYQSAMFSGIDNDPSEKVESYTIANVRIAWKSDDRSIGLEAFVDNVFDRQVIQQIFHNTLGSFPTTVTATSPGFDSGFGVWGRPRTWGIRASYSF